MALRKVGAWVGHNYSYDEDVPDGGRDAGEAGFEDGLAADDPDAEVRGHVTIAVVRPHDGQDVYAIGYAIGAHFRRDIPVIINLEDLEVENAKRVVDFVSGTIFGRRGDIERLSNRLFLIVPPNSTIVR